MGAESVIPGSRTSSWNAKELPGPHSGVNSGIKHLMNGEWAGWGT